MTRSHLLYLLALLGCCAAIAACTSGCRTTAAQKQPRVEPVKKEPPVKIEAYYPLNESHQFIADYLKEFAAKHPGEVELEIIDFRYPEGRERWMKTGLGCAGVFINGKTSYEIQRNGKTETVDFIKRMDVMWTREDFETVVNQLLEKAREGGKPAEEKKGEQKG